MWRFFAISTVLSIIFVLGLWIQVKSRNLRFLNFDLRNHEPFDNFKYFNDLEEIENEDNFCQPFLIRPKQADLLELSSPIVFSCNSPMKRWSNFSNGILTISEKLIERRFLENNKNFNCVYAEIISVGELSNGTLLVESSNNEIIIEPGIPTRIDLEQFVVFCRDPTGHHFYNKTYFNFLPKLHGFRTDETESLESLIILSISGMSHNQALRHMKQTLTFAAENDFLSFSMFNQESNDNWKNSLKTFGDNEKIWDVAGKANKCATFLNTDSSKLSKLYGNQFDYNSNLYNFFNKRFMGHVDNCISDGSVTVEDAVALWTNSTKVFNQRCCYLSLLHLSELSGPEDGKIVNLDEGLRNSLEEVFMKGIIKNTTVVILSDGGSNTSHVFNTESGKIEAKYGLFLIRLSENYRKKFPKKAENMKKNVDRLITNKSVAETLKFLISNQNYSTMYKNTLFDKEISKDDTCKTAGILPEYCICSTNVILENKRKNEIVVKLQLIVKREFSTHKCLEEINIESENLKFRNYGSTYFFRFHGFVATKINKISGENSYSKPIQIKFRGRAKFLNTDDLHLELSEPLKLVGSNSSSNMDRVSLNCYENIVSSFENNM